jgi:hypothetical protein
LIVAAVSGDSVLFPASHPRTFAATAYDTALHVLPHHPSGSDVDIAAPGMGIRTAVPADPYDPAPPLWNRFFQGSSAAAPHVAAAAALVKQKHPHWTPQAIRDQLAETSDHMVSYGFGALRVDRALGLVQPPPSLAIHLDGPTWIGWPGTYGWSTQLSNVQGPPFYQWYINWGYGWEHFLYGEWPWSVPEVALDLDASHGNFGLKVTVSDGHGYAEAETYVDVWIWGPRGDGGDGEADDDERGSDPTEENGHADR